jgi:hypothetical protein
MVVDTQTLDRVTRELQAREPIFHRPEFGSTRADFEAMMAGDFSEVGASGKKYSRDYVLQVLEERMRTAVEDVFTVTDFACRAIAADTFLATYQLEQARGRRSRRATVWRRGAQGWIALYHQGTLISGPDTDS